MVIHISIWNDLSESFGNDSLIVQCWTRNHSIYSLTAVTKYTLYCSFKPVHKITHKHGQNLLKPIAFWAYFSLILKPINLIPGWKSCTPPSPSPLPSHNVGSLFLEMTVDKNPPQTTLRGGGWGGGLKDVLLVNRHEIGVCISIVVAEIVVSSESWHFLNGQKWWILPFWKQRWERGRGDLGVRSDIGYEQFYISVWRKKVQGIEPWTACHPPLPKRSKIPIGNPSAVVT